MKLTIHQPNFLPRLKVLQKLASADYWVVLDTVQYAQREWQNRAKILPMNRKQGEFWLTLPVNLPTGRGTAIKDVEVIDLNRSLCRFRNSLSSSFRSTAHWNAIYDYWNMFESKINSNSLLDITMASTLVALQQFGRTPKVILASSLNANSKKSLLMADICRELDATEYLSDSGATRYLDESLFQSTAVKWQHWIAPLTEVKNNDEWRNISFLSYLAARGTDNLQKHIHSGVFESYPMR